MTEARYVYPAGSLNVELDESNCVVIRQPRLRSAEDVILTVTDVDRLRTGLQAAHALQGIVDAGEAPAAAAWPRDGVERVLPGRWMVPSASTPGAFWKVEQGHRPKSGNFWTCTCPAGRARGEMGPVSSKELANRCRHVRAVQAAEERSTYPPRPAGRPNPSAIVD